MCIALCVCLLVYFDVFDRHIGCLFRRVHVCVYACVVVCLFGPLLYCLLCYVCSFVCLFTCGFDRCNRLPFRAYQSNLLGH